MSFDLLDTWDELEERRKLEKLLSFIFYLKSSSFPLGLHQGGNQALIYHYSSFVKHLEASRREAYLSRVSSIHEGASYLGGGSDP